MAAMGRGLLRLLVLALVCGCASPAFGQWDAVRDLLARAGEAPHYMPNDTHGLAALPLPDYDCETDAPANWHVADWSGDMRPDLIYNGLCNPYPQTAFFLNTGDGMALVLQTAGGLCSLRQGPDGCTAVVMCEAVGCMAAHTLRAIDIDGLGQVRRNLALSWMPEMGIPTAGTGFEEGEFRGILRHAETVEDAIAEDDCFGLPAMGNRIAELWTARKGLSLATTQDWRLVCVELAPERWQVGWISQKDMAMNDNETTIRRLYEGFLKKDYRQMAECYHDDATFQDPVFTLRNGKEVRAMWHYLIANGKDLRVEFADVKAAADRGSAHWEAWYSFSATGRKVHNIIDAEFEFRDGKIIRHRDRFNFWRWSRQALGGAGVLLGWTPIVKGKVRKTAAAGLAKFIKEHPEYQ